MSVANIDDDLEQVKQFVEDKFSEHSTLEPHIALIWGLPSKKDQK